MNQSSLSALIWSVADLLRGDYKQSEYGRVILPFTVLRRLDCVLEPTKKAVLAECEAKTKAGLNPDPFLLRKAKQSFYNTSPLDLPTLLGDQDHIRQNLYSYIQGFSPAARDIFERFDFHAQVERLAKADLLYLVTEKFANFNLHPDEVDNAQMGLVFEELIRKFAELSNETAGEHFTPREVIRLMVNLIFIEDDEALGAGHAVRTIYDPTAGTGGMLSVAAEHLLQHNPDARLTLFGQELNDESYAICKADMLIRGQDVSNIIAGNTLSEDGHAGRKFDYMLSNPPFGVEWKKVEKVVRSEHEQKGFDGRFGPGLPRVSDGSMLFLLHLVSKMRPAVDGGSRFGIVLNGSPLFTGGAGSGESEIRRYVLENDLMEAIIGLPTDMFYNTGIATYVWIISNKKPDDRKGYVQLIDAGSFWQKMRKSLGSKRKEMSDEHIATITRLFGEFAEAELATVFAADGRETGRQVIAAAEFAPAPPPGGKVKVAPLARVFKNQDFGYTTITVERPLRDEQGRVVLGQKGKQKGLPQADSSLRDTENVPLGEDIQAYFEREVLPHVPGAWIDEAKSKVGYEIPFNRHFYVFEPPRELQEIDEELKAVSERIMAMLGELAE
ncbi:restriction endonuclease subunit M [Rhodanobacter thiooxydans]|uniref:site-specific DNA-methyltransferase (adenine-specific) n=1 Tax=Rhodanobacter thiooxydans TaxID=416169 RepID=A0A154QK95_9GAMM|nr:class I SAM-dependent DNA methyltransferase [Rhodanobacter thiooxydans]EIL99371.1 type I restriction-modification methylase m subunit, n-6 DNA methylase [Rhodanobacter thiooxydans LCS2]KZC24157.1 restriction endonuclease subunit M [Rhodanobacter thiooxydans]MCW0203784.1 type I restriction-modification system subunit M [Rhodanobacter thiooxydans]